VSRDGEAGSATVWALIVVLAVWVAAALAVVETVVIQTRHEAEAVADAVALAGASDGGLDPVAACASARDVASAHRARLLSCLVAGPVVTVEVSVPPPDALDWAGRVTARARAGPANTGVPDGTLPSRTAS
jgi:secretion/DNA translocation related TadE-like protein